MVDFRDIHSATNHSGQQFSNPISAASRLWARILLGVAVALIALAVFVLIFPRVLAVFVAAIFILGAVVALRFAWKLHLTGRNVAPPTRQVDVIVDPDDSQLER